MNNLALVVQRWFCTRCETPTVQSTTLGFLDPDGAVGNLAGFACVRCRDLWAEPGAEPEIVGWVDLEGLA